MDERHRWEFWIDVGGTFTDCFARTPDGRIRRHKLLSSGITPGRVGDQSDQQRIIDPLRSGDPPGYWTGYQIRIAHEQLDVPFESRICQFDPADGLLLIDPPLPLPVQVGGRYELWTEEEAPLAAIRYLSGRTLDEPLPEADVRLGTTRGTNALLTRSGAKTALITTRGFADVLLVGYQDRPRLFDLQIRKSPPLYEATIEIDERISAEGEVLQSPDAETVRAQLTALRRDGIEALAICLLHAYRYPEHEQFVLRCAQEVGFHNSSLSSDVAHLMGIVARGDTTVVDAYLNPVLQEYIDRIEAKLDDTGRLRLMTSAGGLVSGSEYRGKDSILSGPAGGVVGFSEAAKACGFDRAIGFDMGGTSTDTSRYDGSFSLEYEREKAGVRLVAPMMAIHTVAAGGGSICRFDGVKPVVGPESAGADPGPACYGRGGPLTVTDVNLLLGKISPPRFPFPLDRAAAMDRADRLVEQIREQSGRHYQRLQLCEGFIQIANANMAAAVREISIAQGVDPRDYLLVAFGGAAAQHACGIAHELQMQRILIHPDAGILSAYGIGRARILRHAARGIYALYETERLAEMEAIFEELSAQARQQVLAEGVDQRQLESSRFLELRYQGTDSSITIYQPTDGDYATAYHREHRSRYGYDKPDDALEIVAARIEVASRTEGVPSRSVPLPPTTPEATDHQDVYFEGRLCTTSIFDHAQLEPGDRLPGPAIICSATSTVVVDPGWQATMYSGGELLIDGQDQKQKKIYEVTTESDPIMLEVFNNRFMAIARQMGITLRNTASSVNVKQRLDFSCAIFTSDGALVANAPHVPVHLGAMGATVRSILKENRPLKPGDVYLTNDPYRGGSHLPDITVVTPVHDPNDDRLLFFTASRAHHAEIGGIRPGSMPPNSKILAEEGVLLENVALFEAGRSRISDVREILESAEYPSRNIRDNLADIAAQDAANRQGSRDLATLVAQYSLPVIEAYMGHIQAAAAKKMQLALARFPDGRYQFADALDMADESVAVCVTIDIREESATFDFSGTAPVLAGNLNANRAIVTAAIMYCLRCLIDEDIPLNEGVLSPITILLPECLLNPPRGPTPQQCAAVAAGNVETSQRVVDTILGALGVAAASQGTMNNLLFGDSAFAYYETICGGAGATAAADGADAVQTHMTNTRLTDIEILEDRYPVRVRQFAIRRGSGGRGRFRGGDGVIRSIEFLDSLEVSILSQRRGKHPPYGLLGGEPGAIGKNCFTPAGDSPRLLPGNVQFVTNSGDVLTIETPGGGGYGTINESDPS